ncbi:MAG: DUF2813 domain-containing protein, partial [Alcaligenaceae bacterium]
SPACEADRGHRILLHLQRRPREAPLVRRNGEEYSLKSADCNTRLTTNHNVIRDCPCVFGEEAMRIKKIEVANYRALRNSSLNFSEVTALIGENNSGKSAFLQAINLFFGASSQVKDRDFSDGNVNDPISGFKLFT